MLCEPENLLPLLVKTGLGISLAFQRVDKLISDLQLSEKSQDHPKDFRYYWDYVMHGS